MNKKQLEKAEFRDLMAIGKQRDELLAALKGLLGINAVKSVIAHAELNNKTTPAYEKVKAARAAIANAEESKP
jgi:hypothetical protein